MKITKKELERIAGLCRLSFTDDEYRQLKAQFDTKLEEIEVLYKNFESDEINPALAADAERLSSVFAYAGNRENLS